MIAHLCSSEQPFIFYKPLQYGRQWWTLSVSASENTSKIGITLSTATMDVLLTRMTSRPPMKFVICTENMQDSSCNNSRTRVWTFSTKETQWLRKLTDADLSDTGSSMSFKDLIEEFSVLVGSFNVGDFIPYVDWLDLQGLKGRMKKSHKVFDAVAEKIIDEHLEVRRRRSSVDADKEGSKDFVDVLLDLNMNYTNNKTETNITRENFKAIIFDMFSAGMETTATTLEWAMSELIRNPHILNKLQQEIESVVGKDVTVVAEYDIASMEYLHCIVKETLRLQPAVPLLIPHESTQACNVKSPDGEVYTVPAKTRLIVNAWAIGRDPNVWEDPLAFKPERFMGMMFDPVNDQEMRMLPFGAGRRGCPGASMALVTHEIALAQVVHSFDWRIEGNPCELDMNEKSGLTIPREANLFAFPLLR